MEQEPVPVHEGAIRWEPAGGSRKPLAAADVSIEIQRIFDENRLADLKKFMSKRHKINLANTVLMYGFHLFQSAGILVTTIATGYNYRELVWVGVGLNVFSSLIMAYENINTSISAKLMKDISSIRDGTYVDEGVLVDDSSKKDSKSTN